MAEFIYKQVKNYLWQLIVENGNNPEFLLPSENQLAIKFKASRVSVRKAFDELEREQVVQRLKGKGTYPMQKPAQESTSSITFALILSSSESSFMTNVIRGATKYCREKKYLVSHSLFAWLVRT